MFQIDGYDLDNQPAHVRVIPPNPIVYPLAGAAKVVVQPETPPTIEVRWGMDAARREVVAELQARRGTQLVHTLTFTAEDEVTIYEAIVFMPDIPWGQGQIPEVVDPFTLSFEVLQPISEAS